MEQDEGYEDIQMEGEEDPIEDDDDDNIEEDGETSKNEQLECDFSAYVLFHEGRTGAPCLSFDIVEDNLGKDRSCDNPVTCYFVAGSQAANTHTNCITLMKMSNMVKIKQNDSDDESDGDDDDETRQNKELPVISSAFVKHNGCVNRIRATKVNNINLCATWSETSQVHIFDMTPMMDAVNDKQAQRNFENDQDAQQPLFSFRGHATEGFGIDWSKTMPGTLATGDNDGKIHVWKPGQGGTWTVDSRPYTSHTASVEDIQWSPNEPHVFATASVDKCIKIWDERAPPNQACQITITDAHKSDVNVIHWNTMEPYIASGGDDGRVLIWDLRQINTNKSVAELMYHKNPVTTVEWSPYDASVLATGEDDQILQWDLAVERDPDQNTEDNEDTPQQLLFVHRGQHEVKELHWHGQIPGLLLSTAHSGFNIFKTISC